MANIDALFQKMMELKSSDLHLTVGSPPLVRVHGEMQEILPTPLTQEMNQALLYPILTDEQRARFEERHDLDFAYEVSGLARFRGNIFMQRKGIGAVFRIIPTKILNIQELGLPSQVLRIPEFKKGLILVTGATGSGKSTTLAAIINHINETRNEHILTVEDPIEFVHTNKKCLVNQREVGRDTNSFATALKAALREDPDIILVGEMRDLETIELAITAAETGHLVFGTLHTSSAPKTVDRIINVFPTEQQEQIRIMLAESLKAVVAQNLLRTADGHGRVVALEILFVTSALSNLIREGKTYQIPSIMQTGLKDGMQTMDQALLDLLKQKKITADEAYRYATDKRQFQTYLEGGESPPPAPPPPPMGGRAPTAVRRW